MNYRTFRPLCRKAPLLAALCATLWGVGARAGVTNFDVFCSNYYYQDSRSAPTVPTYYTFSVRVATESAKDFSAFRVVGPGPVGTMRLEKEGSEYLYFSTFHHDAALRDVDYPEGTLTFTGSGGPVGSESASRVYPAGGRFAAQPPAFADVGELKDVDAGQAIFVTPSYFAVPPGVDYARTFIAVYDEAGDQVFEADSEPNAPGLAVPGGSLRPGAHYTIALFFSSRATILNAGFGGASSQVAWDAITLAPLHTMPGCGSADFDCDGDVGTDADIEAFFACLGGRCPPPPCTSTMDFNGDGDVGTDADIEAFFRVLGGGPC